MLDNSQHHGLPKGEGRKLRRAKNAVKRYAGRTDEVGLGRYQRAQALLLAAALRKDN